MTSRKGFVLGLLLTLLAGTLWFCRSQRLEHRRGAVVPVGDPLEIETPLGLPPVLIPVGNTPTVETVALGRRLFYDPLLSVDHTVACASCHDPQFGFSDGKPVSEGVNGQKGGRNAPTVLNAAYYTTQFWDGRAATLEEQAAGPVQNPIEMAHTLESVEERLNTDPAYLAEFEKAFGSGPVTYEMVAKAIASFERTHHRRQFNRSTASSTEERKTP